MLAAVCLATAAAAALAPGAALARPAIATSARGTSTAAEQSAACVIRSLPSFVAQGEDNVFAMVADVVEVECNPFSFGTGSQVEVSAAQLYSRCGDSLKWYLPYEGGTAKAGVGVRLNLDADGNGTVALIAGPECQAGDSVVAVHELEPPFESFATSFAVLPPGPTPAGVWTFPSTQVEDGQYSSVATIVEAEFPGKAEAHLRLASPELNARCQGGGLDWVLMDGTVVSDASEVDWREDGLQLDDDGNAFALALGDDSCYPGASLIEADLESKPYETAATEFTILPPQPTEEPAFTIEKRQQIRGSASGFTTSPLEAPIDATVEYQITVTNTSNVTESFEGFTDPHCDAGTIAGGPGGSAVPAGQSTTYTCDHVITAVGSYINEVTVTGRTVGGVPLSEHSNKVEVTTPSPAVTPHPAFTIEKLQEIVGSGFTKEQLTAMVGQTVEYEIIVDNTGNVPLTFSALADAHCDPGTIAGGPGAAALAPEGSTTYTCHHVLAQAGTYVNEATLTAKSTGESLTHTSASVEVKVVAPESSFTIEKLQRIAGSGAEYTTAQLAGTVGATVEYEIVVKNTGNTEIALSSFTDPHCDPGTLQGGPGAGNVAVGASTTFTCTRLLTSEGTFGNVATVSGGAPGETPTPLPSHEVETTVPGTGGPVNGTPAGANTPPAEQIPHGGVGAYTKCEVPRPVLHGATGPKRGTFTVEVSALGIKSITFYLDKRVLKRLSHVQARKGQFVLRINASKLSSGPHRISFSTVMSNTNCAQAASSRVFVHPASARVAPSFTG